MRAIWLKAATVSESREEVETAIIRGLSYLQTEARGANLAQLSVAIGRVVATYLAKRETGGAADAETNRNTDRG